MSIISSVSHARKTWLAAASTSLAIITLSSLVGVLTTPFVAFITAAACALVTAACLALARASRTMGTIFAEELDAPRVRQPTPLKRAE